MNVSGFAGRGLREWLVLFVCFTLVGLLFSVSVHSEDLASGQFSYGHALVLEMTGVWSGFLLMPIFLPLAERTPVRGDNWPRMILLHLGVSLVYGVLHSSLMYGSRWFLFGIERHASLVDLFVFEYHKQLMGYMILVAIVNAYRIWKREQMRERERAQLELERSRLETQLSRARLQTLEAQIHPHFLFNTLNTISSLMYTDLDRADKMIADLASLLRMALDDSEHQKIPLRREAAFMERYLAIMKGRYQDDLRVSLDLEEEVMVPSLILQPLVENAIKHLKIEPGQPAQISVNARGEGEELVLTVRDNGPGLDADPEVCMARGIGLRNTRARLTALYGDRGLLYLRNLEEGGLEVEIRLPREACPEEVSACCAP